MKLKLKNPVEKRSNMAKIISCIVQGKYDSNIPFMVSQNDDYWSLDSNNDWRLLFSDDNTILDITYRYNNQNNSKEAALFAWLSVKFDAEII